MIRIYSGWSNKGGSTTAFIALTNALNKAGYDTTFYGPHTWHLDKCKSGSLVNQITSSPIDNVIVHFLDLPSRPQGKQVILSCHEKNLYPVATKKQFWDEVVFLNEKHRQYHRDYKGKFSIIPNLKEPLYKSDKTGLEKVAGIIGSFDQNKQVHISIERALEDGCEQIYLFGEPNSGYYESEIKPYLSDKVILKGYMEDKQAMYDMIGRVYHSSISEVACLVKDECETTGTVFHGNNVTNNPPVLLSNKEIINEWVKLLKL